ncbi:MAG: hypothetical protein ABL902_08350 [Gallionella sp.]
MAKFHLMHCIPPNNPRMHGLIGYSEVIETVKWGLEMLGHKVSYAVNSFDGVATNIIFGAHLLPMQFLQTLPKDSVAYNFEQARGINPSDMPPAVAYIAEHFQIWDYSKANLETWQQMSINDAKLVPVGYAPILTRIHQLGIAIQDIDVLIYGLSGNKRLRVFDSLSNAGIKVVFVSGLYGEARDSLIARSKIVLNINLYSFAQIFEIVRVSYLLANKKAVVATLDENTAIEDDLINAVKFSTLESITEDCAELLAREDKRLAFETAGFETIMKRDIRPILERALA